MSTIYGNGVSAVGGSSDNYDKRSVVTVGIFESSGETEREEWHTEKSCDFFVASSRTNSSRVINEAIASLPKYGGTVVLKPGYYYIDLNNPILIDRQNVCIDGVNGAVLRPFVPDGVTVEELSPMIKVAKAGTTFNGYSSNVSIKNLVFEMTVENLSAVGIQIGDKDIDTTSNSWVTDSKRVHGVTVENCMFNVLVDTVKKIGVLASHYTAHSVIRANRFRFYGNATTPQIATAIDIGAAYGILLSDNVMSTYGASNFPEYVGVNAVKPNGGNGAGFNRIVNNMIYGCAVGIHAATIRAVISHNHIYPNTKTSDAYAMMIAGANNLVIGNACNPNDILSDSGTNNIIENNIVTVETV